MLALTSVKLLTALVIFICGLLSTILPLFVVGKNEAIFSAGNMMASGVLIAAGLVHQLADSSSSLDSEDGYPWSFLICGLTFIMFLIFEESIHVMVGGHSHGDDVLMKVEEITEKSLTHQGSCRGTVAMGTSEPFEISYGSSSGHDHSHQHDHTNISEIEPLRMRRPSKTSSNHEASVSWAASTKFWGDPNRMSVAGTHHHHNDHIAEHLHGSILASLMLLTALSVHSILAGLSIGLVNNVDEIFSTAIAIIAHKVFAGYALGSTMVAADLGWDRHVPLGVAFSFSTPLGIFIGMGLAANTYDEDSMSVGIVKAVVAGTFLYVAIIEVGMKELLIVRQATGARSRMISLSQKQGETLKLVSLLVGFLGMSALAAYI